MSKKRTEKRQPSAEEGSRNADYRLKRFISKSAIELAESDPEVKRQMVAQTFGYKFPDPAEKNERELLAYINEITLRRIKEDPELARRITDARILQVTEKLGLKIAGEERRKKPLTTKELIEKFQEISELKEVLGVRESRWFDAFLDPKVIASVLSMINGIMDARQAPVTNGESLVVRIDGKEKIVTPKEFEKLLAPHSDQKPSDAKTEFPINPDKGNDTISESETSDKAEAREEEADAVGSETDAG